MKNVSELNVELDINGFACAVNDKVFGAEALVTAIELMLCEVSVLNLHKLESQEKLSKQLGHIHSLAIMAKRHIGVASSLGDQLDRHTTGLRRTVAGQKEGGA